MANLLRSTRTSSGHRRASSPSWRKNARVARPDSKRAARRLSRRRPRTAPLSGRCARDGSARTPGSTPVSSRDRARRSVRRRKRSDRLVEESRRAREVMKDVHQHEVGERCRRIRKRLGVDDLGDPRSLLDIRRLHPGASPGQRADARSELDRPPRDRRESRADLPLPIAIEGLARAAAFHALVPEAPRRASLRSCSEPSHGRLCRRSGRGWHPFRSASSMTRKKPKARDTLLQRSIIS